MDWDITVLLMSAYSHDRCYEAGGAINRAMQLLLVLCLP
jgi:hypothetical protein